MGKVIQTITTFKSTTITSHTTATMQKAKQAVGSFLSKDGKHKTTVDQDVNAAVTEEHVKPTQHENVTTAVDREVHQDHHQTRVQPVLAKETLPETSSHNVAPVMHKEFDHGNAQEVRSKLDRSVPTLPILPPPTILRTPLPWLPLSLVSGSITMSTSTSSPSSRRRLLHLTLCTPQSPSMKLTTPPPSTMRRQLFPPSPWKSSKPEATCPLRERTLLL